MISTVPSLIVAAAARPPKETAPDDYVPKPARFPFGRESSRGGLPIRRSRSCVRPGSRVAVKMASSISAMIAPADHLPLDADAADFDAPRIDRRAARTETCSP
jgi:hypothetical protein